jgi:uncharacterized protein (TIGR00369 family)
MNATSVIARRSSNPDYKSRVRSSFKKQGVMRTIGASLVAIEPGKVEIEFPFSRSLTQQHDYIHAGVIATVADSACGYAAFTLMPADSEVLTIEYKVNFMAPAEGERFRVIGKVLKSGRKITVCAGDAIAIDHGKEKIVATILATMMLVKK